MSGRVWAVPLAERGFVPVSDRNRVFWYLEDYETGKALWSTDRFLDKASAEKRARELGFEVIV